MVVYHASVTAILPSVQTLPATTLDPFIQTLKQVNIDMYTLLLIYNHLISVLAKDCKLLLVQMISYYSPISDIFPGSTQFLTFIG